ncbi:hypothetical protein MPL1032_180160 [Mesorhizobium plurifarium]|uniref:Uncharacterized protein n=1 Tax=Mesorhizobium plurifarium TaxID=69974 RepID=A0A0K2VUF4_MESPL|nr:hypothetical protein MPL1032_180160 [Mesorhizobium plurifarium]
MKTAPRSRQSDGGDKGPDDRPRSSLLAGGRMSRSDAQENSDSSENAATEGVRWAALPSFLRRSFRCSLGDVDKSRWQTSKLTHRCQSVFIAGVSARTRSPGRGACDANTRWLLEDPIDEWSDKEVLGAAYLDIPRSAPAAWAGAWGETAGARHSRRAAPFRGSDTHSQPSRSRVPAVLV